MTHTLTIARHPSAFFMAATATLASRLVRRRTLRMLNDLDDHLLRDIGLTRADLANFQPNRT